jgi:carbonic anhydrase
MPSTGRRCRRRIPSTKSLIAPAADLAGASSDGRDDYLTRLEQASITKSLENLLTFPYIESAVKCGVLALHGAYFDVSTGQVFVRDASGYCEISAEA